MHKIFIGIGSNLGARQAHILRALGALQALPCTHIRNSSAWYFNPPLGLQHQGHYLNGVVELHSTLPPNTLLRSLKRIERQIGRKQKRKRWGPRVIDLDVLLFDRVTLKRPHLQIPHPQVWLRDFTLVPLMELFEHIPPRWQARTQQAYASLEKSELKRTPFSPPQRTYWRP